jgi:hypothetical protein
MVRIRFPPAESQERTCVLCIKDVDQLGAWASRKRSAVCC